MKKAVTKKVLDFFGMTVVTTLFYLGYITGKEVNNNNVKEKIRNEYNKGYKEGYKDGCKGNYILR